MAIPSVEGSGTAAIVGVTSRANCQASLKALGTSDLLGSFQGHDERANNRHTGHVSARDEERCRYSATDLKSTVWNNLDWCGAAVVKVSVVFWIGSGGTHAGKTVIRRRSSCSGALGR